jgi:hypothetical protein
VNKNWLLLSFAAMCIAQFASADDKDKNIVYKVVDGVNIWQEKLLCDKGWLNEHARWSRLALTALVAWRVSQIPVVKEQTEKLLSRCGCNKPKETKAAVRKGAQKWEKEERNA